VVSNQAIVAAQNPVALGGYSEPEPDIALLHWRADDYEQSHPYPEDILLIIEVSAGALRYDRDVKVPLYANHGIPDSLATRYSAEATGNLPRSDQGSISATGLSPHRLNRADSLSRRRDRLG
jgi:hypothetical protein